jgi:hypothetical protein
MSLKRHMHWARRVLRKLQRPHFTAWVHRNIDIQSSCIHQAPANTTPICPTNFPFAHNQTVIMDEIAPEYDVVVLGTGGTTPRTAAAAKG